MAAPTTAKRLADLEKQAEKLAASVGDLEGTLKNWGELIGETADLRAQLRDLLAGEEKERQVEQADRDALRAEVASCQRDTERLRLKFEQAARTRGFLL